MHQKEVVYNWSLMLNRQLIGPESTRENDEGTVMCVHVSVRVHVCAVLHEMRVRVQSGRLSHLSLSHTHACTTQKDTHTHTHMHMHTQCPQPAVTKL